MLELITGGSGSGKSEYAEKLAVNAGRTAPEGKLYYIATMYPYDEECVSRIRRHRKMRKEKGFTTIECYTHLERVKVTDKDVVLLECMSNLLANEMYQEEGQIRTENGWEAVALQVLAIAGQAAHMIVVTNEVFSDAAEYDEETGRYIRLLGRINCELSEKADRVTEVVCGIPVLRKGEEGCSIL